MAHDLAGGEHPDVARWRANGAAEAEAITSESLRELMLECGADDCGFVAVSDPAVADQQAWISALLPNARTLVSFVVRMNRDTVRTSVRSVANEEFHQTYDDVNHVARKAVRKLEAMGFGAVNPAAAFPMDDPQYVVVIMLDEPKGDAETSGYATAGWTAAPVVSRVVARIGPLLDVLPDAHRDIDTSTLQAMLWRPPSERS